MATKKHIGLLFGSFNPIHIGHLVLANYMKEMHHLDEVWLVVSPQNPFKNSHDLIDGQLRLKMVEMALSGSSFCKVCNVEFEMPIPSYTIDTLDKLTETYPDIQFTMIMGTDNIQSIYKWKNGERILGSFEILVYPRLSSDTSSTFKHSNVIYTKAPVIDVSSTFIREQIGLGKNMSFFMPREVAAFVQEKKLYQKKRLLKNE